MHDPPQETTRMEGSLLHLDLRLEPEEHQLLEMHHRLPLGGQHPNDQPTEIGADEEHVAVPVGEGRPVQRQKTIPGPAKTSGGA